MIFWPQFQAISRKMNKSPNSKALFVDLWRPQYWKTTFYPTRCMYQVELNLPSNQQHSLVPVCCVSHFKLFHINQKLKFLSSLERQHKKKWPQSKPQLKSSDIMLAKEFVAVLQPFYKITLQVSTEGLARLSQYVVFIDQITKHLSTVISKKKYSPALRNACRAGLQLTKKYYTLTNCSLLHGIAMGNWFFFPLCFVFAATDAH